MIVGVDTRENQKQNKKIRMISDYDQNNDLPGVNPHTNLIPLLIYFQHIPLFIFSFIFIYVFNHPQAHILI